jgi:DNA replication initiation complex subunit (GINS family)
MARKEPLTYEKISQIQHKERKDKRLTKLYSDFYADLASYLNALKRRYEAEYRQNPTSPKTMLLGNDFRKTLQLVRDIYEHRERKIALMAVAGARGAPSDGVKDLTASEQALYEALVKDLKQNRIEILRSMGYTETIAKETQYRTSRAPDEDLRKYVVDTTTLEVPGTISDENLHSERVSEPVSEPTATPAITMLSDNYVVVHVLEDIPEFVGSDLNTYNLSKEDVLTLPRDIATILCKSGKCKIID